MDPIELFGSALLAGINHVFGFSSEEVEQPQRSAGGRGGLDLRWFTVERDELEDFVADCRAAGIRPACADNLLAVLLENGREELIPPAAMRIAELQARNPNALIFVALRD